MDILVPYSEVSDIIDYEKESEKYGSVSLLEIAMVNGEVYEVFPVALPEYITGKIYANCLLAVNEDLIQSLGVLDPREKVEKGNWIWSDFENSLSEYSYGSEEEKVYGIDFNQEYFLINAALSNGVRYISHETDDIVGGITSNATVEAIDWVRKLLNEKKDEIHATRGDYWQDSRRGFFYEGRSVLNLLDTSAVMTHVAYSENIEKFGVVPFPCGPSGTYGDWSCELVTAEGMVILKESGADSEDCAHLISALYEPLPGFETPDAYGEELLRNFFYDARDVDLMLNLYKGGQYFYWINKGRDFWTRASSNLDKSSGKEIVDKFSSILDKVVTDYILPNSDYILSHR